MWSKAVGLTLSAAFVFASVAGAQRAGRRAPGTASDDTVGVAIALQAGGEAYRFAGQASCRYEPNAAIYTVRARVWNVSYSDGTRSASLTFWRPTSGSGDMFTLYVQGGGKTYKADTVKTEHGGSPQGSGSVTFAAAAGGGTFTVNATAANGARITGTFKCDAFRTLAAEAGN